MQGAHNSIGYNKRRESLFSTQISHIIFKRGVNSKSLSPKLPTIPKEATDLNIPNISAKSNEINKDIDTVLDFISDSNSKKDITVRLKRKSPDTDTLSSEENVFKKAKLSHENDDTSIIELNTSAPREITNIQTPEIASTTNSVAETAPQLETQISEVALNTTNSVAETAPQLETQIANLPRYLDSHNQAKDEAFRLIDDLQTTINLLEEYMEDVTVKVKEIEESIYAHTRDNENTYISDLEDNEDVPRLMLDNNSDNVSSHSDYWDNHINFIEDNPDIDNIINSIEDNPEISDDNLSDGSSSLGEDIGMEPLGSGVPSSHVIYTDQMRSDHIIHNNYQIDMSGIDNVDYHMAYEYLIECLDNLDRLMIQHQALEALERIILPIVDRLDIQAHVAEVEILDIFEILSHFN